MQTKIQILIHWLIFRDLNDPVYVPKVTSQTIFLFERYIHMCCPSGDQVQAFITATSGYPIVKIEIFKKKLCFYRNKNMCFIQVTLNLISLLQRISHSHILLWKIKWRRNNWLFLYFILLNYIFVWSWLDKSDVVIRWKINFKTYR